MRNHPKLPGVVVLVVLVKDKVADTLAALSFFDILSLREHIFK